MRLYSWNVNGIRAVAGKGFFDWLEQSNGDVVCLQETKANPEVLPFTMVYPPGFQATWAAAEKKGYSGVATFSKHPVKASTVGLGIERFDREGRVVITEYEAFDLYNVYFPNGDRSGERLDYKLDFYAAFLEHVNERVRGGRNVIFCGDVNTAHNEIDLARPKENVKNSGFMPKEREWLDRWTAAGWVDTFRLKHPDVAEAYSWWDQRTGARPRNVGWRIDYFWVHERLADKVIDAGICPDVYGSDHCPVWLDLAV